jgi:hypothetical protein
MLPAFNYKLHRGNPARVIYSATMANNFNLQACDKGQFWEILDAEELTAEGDIELEGTPRNNNRLVMRLSGARKYTLDEGRYSYLDQVAENYVVQICNTENGDGKDYRYGFNGQEKVDEIAGVGNHNTALFWEYDTRLGRRWNVDPVDQVSVSNYAVNADNPIINIDPNGDHNYYLNQLGVLITKIETVDSRDVCYIVQNNSTVIFGHSFDYSRAPIRNQNQEATSSCTSWERLEDSDKISYFFNWYKNGSSLTANGCTSPRRLIADQYPPNINENSATPINATVDQSLTYNAFTVLDEFCTGNQGIVKVLAGQPCNPSDGNNPRTSTKPLPTPGQGSAPVTLANGSLPANVGNPVNVLSEDKKKIERQTTIITDNSGNIVPTTSSKYSTTRTTSAPPPIRTR